MRRAYRFIISLWLVTVFDVVIAAPGVLIAVGGGANEAPFQRQLLESAGGSKATILIIPQASERSDAGEGSVKAFSALGATNVKVLTLDDKETALKLIRAAEGIWISGGSQGRLMNELSRAGVVAEIRERFAKGLPIGGTSAGAAILSRTMIIGNPESGKPPGTPPPIVEGLALWPEVIVDQHFSERKRFGRLEAAVMINPTLVGVGIDESTAVIVRGKEFEVAGKGTVQVLFVPADAKQNEGGTPQTNPRVITLKAGQKFDLEKRK